jgi:membrane protease YdiL (CAAX protease family)
MKKSMWLPITAVVVAIAITSAMDATGYANFSALPLFPLMLIFWSIQRNRRREIGFTLAAPKYFVLAMLYPMIIFSIVAALAFANHALDLSHTNWTKALLNVALLTTVTFLVATITEEGFFRGWLWAALARAGLTPAALIFWTSVAFSLWHWSAITLDTGFNVPIGRVPLFMLNAAVLGAVWAVMRERSGSILVSSLSHGLWNGCDYVLFGFGTHHGALGIADTAFYGPEVGLLGLGLNVAFLLLLLLFGRSGAAVLRQ